jgi:predicted RNase H-like nuclease
MAIVCGVDGCRAGWVAVCFDPFQGRFSCRILTSFRELSQLTPLPDVIGVDIPIGLTESGPRECDRVARQLLGPGRGSSVFPAPLRPILEARTYDEACRARARIEGKRISLQTWGIIPKIREVDAALRADPVLGSRVREVHPEVCFFHMAGMKPMRHSKKTKPGHEERRYLLTEAFGPDVEELTTSVPRAQCGRDDVIDALAALWTARQISLGQERTLPTSPCHDRLGQVMEIVV